MADHIQIGDISPRIQYAGDAVQTVFTYPFPIFVDADMEIYEDTTLKILSTDYTVSGAGSSSGGTVTFMIAPAAGVAVTLKRNVAIARTSDFQESGEFRAKVINDELDILTALLQQVDEQSGRSLRLGPTDSAATTFIPARADRAGRFLGFDAGGEPIASAGSVDTLAVSTFMATLLDDTDAAAVRATLGLAIGADVLAPTGDGSGLTGIVTGATAAERANIALNAFRIAVNGGLSVQNMADGVVDEFTDETGVDTVTSSNETYDPTGDYYSNYSGGYTANTVPLMTTDTLPSGTASESIGNVSAFKAFNGVVSGNPWGGLATALPAWVAYEHVSAKTITKYQIIGYTNGTVTRTPKNWTFEAWNGSAWVVLDTQSGIAWVEDINTGSVPQSFTFTNTTAYTKYRLNISANNGDTYVQIHSLEMYEDAGALDMTLQSNAAAALAQPDDNFLVLWHEPVDAVTLNTDLKAYASRDGGMTWTQATLALAAGLTGNEQILTGSADISAQPVGVSMKWKVETLNSKQQRLRGVSQQWS